MTGTKRTLSTLSNSRGVGNSIHGLLYLHVHVFPIYSFLTPPPPTCFLYRKTTMLIGGAPSPSSERTYFLNGLYDIITTADVIVLQGMKLCILVLFVQTVPFFIYFNNKWFLRLHNILSFNHFLFINFSFTAFSYTVFSYTVLSYTVLSYTVLSYTVFGFLK